MACGSEQLSSSSGWKGNRTTLTYVGEQWFDLWMEKIAKVYWVAYEEPWMPEEVLISSIPLPLNIQGNTHPLKPSLLAMRSKALAEAKLMEIANETGFSRRKVVEIVD
ncbi:MULTISPECIES: GIY-YIG nuclease family protein [Enterobacter]|uniref:GIY-YIG nuclease family protein n=1 Tax=Enterobacter TaxID=547 RepID=UPI002B220A4F|nr:hypothetical protein [Enterobacter hormaechei]MED5749089.1 hypothetical protein [Enterobacter hormaechei]